MVLLSSGTKTREEYLAECLRWALEWIDAVPNYVVLPSMPGFDRDYVNNILAGNLPEDEN